MAKEEQPRTGSAKSAANRRAAKATTRTDAPGMKRGSLYATADSLAAFDAAVNQVLDTLGGDTPRHVAVSALLEAGAAHADEIARQLAAERAAELAEQLETLRQRAAE